MHAGFASFTKHLQHTLHLGTANSNLPEITEKLGGPIVAQGIAAIFQLGFVYIMRDAILDAAHAQKAMRFFNDNFVISDPSTNDGQRYYQGKFLLRTKKAGDNLNVHVEFCKHPEDIFFDSPFGKNINPLKIITTSVIDEKTADRLESDPSKVDLVIRFKDLASIINLAGKEDVDIVGLLLENVVQLTGNVGHLFKLGAIATDIELSLNLDKQPR